MKINELHPAVGSTRNTKRLGRGIGSGTGKTAGKGHKGQNARSGGGVRLGFEGGQMPLTRRLPKVGFTHRDKKIYNIVNVSALDKLDNGTVVSNKLLLDLGIISKLEPYGLKVLGNGALTKKLTVQAAKFSDSAKKIIEDAGGSTEVV